jgi:hypothetical protein
MAMPMPRPVASHDGAGGGSYRCTAAPADGTSDDRAANRATSRSRLRECVRQRYRYRKRQ